MENFFDMQILKPFIDGTKHTFLVQCQTEIQHGKPYLKTGSPQQGRIDIAGTVGILSTKFKGNLTICFPEKTFLNIMEKMLMEKFENINADNSDGAAEVTNIIFGYAKKVLNEQGHDIEKALPTVTFGNDIKICQSGDGPIIILPFSSGIGDFHLEIAFLES